MRRTLFCALLSLVAAFAVVGVMSAQTRKVGDYLVEDASGVRYSAMIDTRTEEIGCFQVVGIGSIPLFEMWETTVDSIAILPYVSYEGREYPVLMIADKAFQRSGVRKVTLPKTMVVIGSSAFSESKLAEIELNEGLTTIGEGAFFKCDSLRSIRVPASVSEIGFHDMGGLVGSYCMNPFMDCSSLESIDVAEGNEEYLSVDGLLIKRRATLVSNGDNSLFVVPAGKRGKLVVPPMVRDIAGLAFCGCLEVKEIILPEKLRSIHSCAFQMSGIRSILIPDSVETIGSNAFYCCYDLERIAVGKGNRNYKIKRGMLFDSENNLVSIPAGKTYSTLSIPKGTASLMEASCHGCVNKCVVPEGIEVMPAWCLVSNFDLKEVVLPSTIKIIGNGGLGNVSLRVVCSAAEPPYVEEGEFDWIFTESLRVEVPKGSVQAYKDHEVWGRCSIVGK